MYSFSGGNDDSVAGEGSDVEDFLDAYGNVIDPNEIPSAPASASAAAKHSSVDSDSESNVSKEAPGQKDGKKKKKQKKKKNKGNAKDKESYKKVAFMYSNMDGGAPAAKSSDDVGKWKLSEPRESNLSQKEQWVYLGLMDRFAGYTTGQTFKNSQEREDFNIYKHMRSIVLCENEEFQAFAKEIFERPERREARCQLANVARRFVEEYYEHRHAF